MTLVLTGPVYANKYTYKYNILHVRVLQNVFVGIFFFFTASTPFPGSTHPATECGTRFPGFVKLTTHLDLRGCIQKFPDWVYNDVYAYNNKHSLGSNTKGYGGKTH
jgi:hypothetical protein